MSNYTVQLGSTGWSDKDGLPSGSTDKIVKGSEFQDEFNAISTAVATKYDSTSTVDINGGAIDNTSIGATTAASGTFTTLTVNTSVAGSAILDEDDMASDSATKLATQQSIKAYVDSAAGSGVFASDITVNGLTVGQGNADGASNTAVGIDSLDSVSTGSSNAAFGYKTMAAGTSVTSSVAVGASAMELGTGGNNNVAVGYHSLRNVTQVNNTAVGSQAAKDLTTGQNNVAVGKSAMQYNTTGSRNVGVGADSCGGTFGVTTTGSNNTCVGYWSGKGFSSAHSNTTIGYQAGNTLTTGSNNTCIGFESDTASSGSTNSVTLGNSSIVVLRCNITNITGLSDARDKTAVEPLKGASDFIKALNPVSFEWNQRDGNRIGQQDHGFIAQDLQAVQKVTGYEVPRLVMDENPEKLEAAYGTLLPTIVAALQEALAEIETLKAQLGNA